MATPKAPEDIDQQKYDRQLRLWGVDGQKRLQKAHICVLGSSAAATETLKNLVLPSVGQFTIVDNAKVAPRDLGSNFFVVKSSLGKSRAEETARMLHELNSDVEAARTVDKDPSALINADPSFVKQYTLIIANDVPEPALVKLGAACAEHNVPLVIVNTYGFIGYIRVFLSEHTIIESKPDFASNDLRLSSPFPELQAYADKWHFEKLNSAEHSHIPFPVILLQAAGAWKKAHNGSLPSSSTEKDAFKKSILAMMAKADEENFAEAERSAKEAFLPYQIPPEVAAILADAKADPANITAKSTNFWVMAAALKQFVANEGHGTLPLNGAVPDMTAETATYISLQTVYKNKADADVAAIKAHVQALLERVGRSPSSITDDEIKLFSNNSAFLRMYRYRTLAQEHNSKEANTEAWSWALDTPKESNAHWYLLIRGVEKFRAIHGHFPASDVNSENWEGDIEGLKKIVHELLAELSLDTGTVSDEYIKEIARYGGSQLHTVSAIIGGAAAQEVIKIVTQQWIPANNTYIFNGLDANSNTFAM